jgi:hypothetical protein
LLDQHDERAAQNNSCNGICTVPSAARELNISSASTAEPTFNVRQISYLGRIRSVLALALMQTPHRFRTKDSYGRTAHWPGDPDQRRLPLCSRSTAAFQESDLHPGVKTRTTMMI